MFSHVKGHAEIDVVELRDGKVFEGIIVEPGLRVVIMSGNKGLRIRLEPDEARALAVRLIEIAGKVEDGASWDEVAGNA